MNDLPLYAPCPRCRGERQVFAYTHISNGFDASRGEYFQCPLCTGMGDIERERAEEWTADSADDD